MWGNVYRSSAENSSFTNISPLAQTFDIKKHKSHNVQILLCIFFYIYLFNAFTYQFLFGRKNIVMRLTLLGKCQQSLWSQS